MKLVQLLIGNKSRQLLIKFKSTRDWLTQVFTRKYFFERLAQEWHQWERIARNGQIPEDKKKENEFALIMIDIDNFKYINDTWGHLVGDEILKIMGQILLTKLRKSDTPARYGGDEFIILLTRTNKESAEKVAKRIEASFLKYLSESKVSGTIPNFEDLQKKIGITWATASCTEAGNIKELIKIADERLLAKKKEKKLKQAVQHTN